LVVEGCAVSVLRRCLARWLGGLVALETLTTDDEIARRSKLRLYDQE